MATITSAAAKLKVLRKALDETFEEGDVIRFSVTYAASTGPTYAAIYCGNKRWYMTGAVMGQGITTSQLMDKLVEPNVQNAELATGWTSV